PNGQPLASTSGNKPQERSIGPNDGAGSYRAVVTRAAFCAGTTETQTLQYPAPYNLRDGVGRAETVPQPKFSERASNVLPQAVALNYTYFVQNPPVSLHCTMNVSKFINFVQNQSDLHILWYGNKSDEASRTQRINAGLPSCQQTGAVQPVTG